ASPAQELGRGRPADHAIGEVIAVPSRRGGHHGHLVPRALEPVGEIGRVDLQAADLRQEGGGVDEDPHAARRSPKRSAWRSSECPRYQPRAASAIPWRSPPLQTGAEPPAGERRRQAWTGRTPWAQ